MHVHLMAGAYKKGSLPFLLFFSGPSFSGVLSSQVLSFILLNDSYLHSAHWFGSSILNAPDCFYA